MRITFFAFTKREPLGGALTVYEFANGMRRRGHEVNLVHYTWGRAEPYQSIAEIEWADFEDGISHSFTNVHGSWDMPEADFICPPSVALHQEAGLPFDVLQGYQMMFPRADEDDAIRAPYPKVCVAKWLVALARGLGVPAHQLVHIPNGINHERFRVVTPMESRPLQVSMLYRNHPRKGPEHGLQALKEVKRRLPEARVVLFSQLPPAHEIPDGSVFWTNPVQTMIIEEIYNQSRVFLCPSVVEGFGQMCVEAMACGAALVTTSNGGSDDYAFEGETALICQPGDATALADHVETLLRDDDIRIRIAERGREYVKRFDWDLSAAKLERFLFRYGANPERYQQPAAVA